jgi:hypothetical protein
VSPLLALMLVATQAPCEGVFDRTEKCAAPAALEVQVADPAPEPPSTKDEAADVGGRFLAASGVSLVLSSAAATMAVWTGGHIAGLAENDGLDGTTLTQLRDQQRAAVITATAGYVATFVLAGTGIALFIFDPAEGDVRKALEVLE